MLLHPYSTAVGVLGPRQPLNKDTITYNVMGKIKSSLLIILICTMSFVSGYTSVSKTSFVFASAPEGYIQSSSDTDLANAFRAYCKSRNLNLEGTTLGAITSFTTQTFNNICDFLNYDLTALQAEVYYKTSGNSGLQWYFTSSGIAAYNRIFAEFLQNNNLNVGDSVNDTLQSGLWFEDVDGYGCFVYDVTTINTYGNYPAYFITHRGTFYKYTGSEIYQLANSGTSSVIFNLSSLTNNISKRIYISSDVAFIQDTAVYKLADTNTSNYIGDCIIFRMNGSYYLGAISREIIPSVNRDREVVNQLSIINFPTGTQLPTVNITITTNNTTINNNTYEGDTIINPDGTPQEPGGGGGDTPDTPVLPEPDLDPAEDWDIELPDLNINWILSGKQNKFPFDIPFNVMYALELLQAEPEAPRIQGTLDLVVYEWNYDLDLSDFDSVASICRNMEFLAFLTGLMLMTRKLIWG